MSWRGSNTIQDKIFASLTYLVPLVEVLRFGAFLFALLPPLEMLFSPLSFLSSIYGSYGGLLALAIFFGLYFGVVRNQSLSYFLRFHTMQALLLGIFAWLCEYLLQLFGLSQQLVFGGFPTANDPMELLVAIVSSAIFIFVVGGSIYSIFQALRGETAKIPIISDAANSQV